MHAAAAGGEHQGFDAGLDVRPQRIDVALHVGTRLVGCRQVVAHHAAAAVRRRQQADAEKVEHAGGSGVDVGCQRGLHAALPDQHGARMRTLGPGAGRAPGRHARLEFCRQKAAQRLCRAQQRRETATVRHDGPHRAAIQPFLQRTRHALFDQFATDVQQAAIMHALRTAGFAGTATQAAVQMKLQVGAQAAAFEHLEGQRGRQRGCVRFPAFEEQAREVDAATRPVPALVQQAEGRTDGFALAADHAGAQQAFRLQAQFGVTVLLGQFDFHVCISLGFAGQSGTASEPHLTVIPRGNGNPGTGTWSGAGIIAK